MYAYYGSAAVREVALVKAKALCNSQATTRCPSAVQPSIPSAVHSGPRGRPLDVRFRAGGHTMYVHGTSGFTTSARPFVRLEWDVFWTFSKNLQNHKSRSLFLQRILHRTTPTHYWADKYTGTRWTCFTCNGAVLNSYICFPIESIVGVGEVLQKSF